MNVDVWFVLGLMGIAILLATNGRWLWIGLGVGAAIGIVVTLAYVFIDGFEFSILKIAAVLGLLSGLVYDLKERLGKHQMNGK